MPRNFGCDAPLSGNVLDFGSGGWRSPGHLDGRAGLDSFHADAPSAAILDLHLPKLPGQHLCKEMKAAAPSIPIVILTASCDLNDKVILLEMGADDYITKPFSPRELLARKRVAQRHSNQHARENEVMFDGIVVNFEKMEVARNGASIALTVHEFKTLQFFFENPDPVITRAELLKRVCGYEDGYTTMLRNFGCDAPLSSNALRIASCQSPLMASGRLSDFRRRYL